MERILLARMSYKEGDVLAQTAGNAGLVSSQPRWPRSVRMRWRAEVSRLMALLAAL